MRLRELPRLLHVRSQYGYTTRASEAMSAEPEAVSADYQAQLTRRAAQNAAERESAELRQLQAQALLIVEQMSALQLTPRQRSTIRASRRLLVRLTDRQPPGF